MKDEERAASAGAIVGAGEALCKYAEQVEPDKCNAGGRNPDRGQQTSKHVDFDGDGGTNRGPTDDATLRMAAR